MSRSVFAVLQAFGRDRILAAAIVLLVIVLAGCSDDRPTETPSTEPSPTEPPPLADLNAFILSEPVTPASTTSDNLAPALSTLSVTGTIYISLQPGSVPGGSSATIRNETTGQVLRVPVTDGGFDPVPLAASVGDDIVLEVFGSAGLLATEGTPVPPRQPPKVVRTVPPKGKTDVPLNSRIYVIFSEPLDGGSVSDASIQLFDGTTPVAVSVQLVGESGLFAEVIPNAPLDPETQYHLTITQDILDRSGDALETPVSVQFTTGPLSTTANTTAGFCGVSNTLGYSNAPIFFAVQDGDGPWTEVESSGDYSYTFAVASGRGALAYVTQYSDEFIVTTVRYGTQAELNVIDEICPATPGPAVATRTVHVRLQNVGASQLAWVNASGLFGSPSPTNETDFTMWSVQVAPFDLVALRYNAVVTPNGFGPPYVVDAGIIRRDQNPVPNSTMPVLDFASAEAFAPVVRNLTINNLAGEQTRVDVQYRTAKAGFGWLTIGAPLGAGVSQQYPGIPNAQPGDLHTLFIGATDTPSWDYSFNRTITVCFKDAVDRTVTLPPHLGPVTVSVAATAPRGLRFQYSLQPEYNRRVGFSSYQGSTTVNLTVSPGYLGTATAVDITFPDLTNLSGWNAGWGPIAGILTDWSAGAAGWTGAGTIAPECGEGDVVRTAGTWGSFTP